MIEILVDSFAIICILVLWMMLGYVLFGGGMSLPYSLTHEDDVKQTAVTDDSLEDWYEHCKEFLE